MALPNRGDRLAGRYEILELLGQGAMGRVYRARDLVEDCAVAVKVLHAAGGLDDQHLRRFDREILSLRRLAHPHILQYRDHGREDETMFLVTELVEGQTLSEVKATFLGQAEKVLLLGARLAAAFEAAHRAGVIHRDIKPGNLFLTDSGEPRILDYGLARFDMGATSNIGAMPTVEQLTQSNVLLGTIPYMSPEQIRAETADTRSDLFSLAVVLYELAGGRRPYVGADLDGLLRAMEQATAPPLGQLHPGLGEPTGRALDTVLRRALQPQPSARFQTMGELAEALDRAANLHGAVPQDATLAVLLPPALGTGSGDAGNLQGRETELAAIREGLARSRQGRGGALLFEAPAGAGRTRLIAEAIRIGHGAGALCLTALAPASPAEGRQALTSWLERAAEVFPEDDRVATALSRFVSRTGPAARGKRRTDDVLTALRGLARRMPLLLVLEDVHRARLETLDLLRQLVAAAPDAQVLLLMTLRSDAAPQPTTAAALKRLLDAPELRRLVLTPLGADALRRMAEEAYPGIELTPTLAEQLARRSGGNPFLARAILRLLERDGTLKRFGVDWEIQSIERLPVPPEATEILRERLAGVAESDMHLLRAGAVLGERFEAPRLADLLEGSSHDVGIRLRVLARISRVLVSESDVTYRFDQPLTRELILESLDAQARADLHARAGAALAARAGDDPAPHEAAAIAHHYLEADQDEEALPFCVRAGLGLRDAGSPDQAVEWLSQARGILERRIERLDEEARSTLRPRLAEIDLGLAECLEGVGRHNAALEVYDQARALGATAELPEIEIRGEIGSARVSLVRGDLLHAQKRARSAGRKARRKGLNLETALALSIEAHALSRSDENEAAEEGWSEAAELLVDGHPAEAAEINFRLGSHFFRLGRFDDALVRYEHAAGLVGGGANPRLYARIQNARAGVIFAKGDPATALALFQEALTLRESIGSRRGVATTLHNIAYCHHHLGDLQESCRISERVVALREELGELARKTESQANLAEALLDLGQIERALAEAGAAVVDKRQLEDTSVLPQCLILAGKIELELGRSERAREIYAEILGDFTEHRIEAFMASVGMAGVEWLSGRREAALTRLGQAFEHVPEDVSTFDLCWAQYLYATLLRHNGGPAERVAILQDALAALDERELLPAPALSRAMAAAELARYHGRDDEAREWLEQALELSESLDTVERTWRIQRDLAELNPADSPERAEGLGVAWNMVREQANLIEDGELRETYLAHRERAELRRAVAGT